MKQCLCNKKRHHDEYSLVPQSLSLRSRPPMITLLHDNVPVMTISIEILMFVLWWRWDFAVSRRTRCDTTTWNHSEWIFLMQWQTLKLKSLCLTQNPVCCRSLSHSLTHSLSLYITHSLSSIEPLHTPSDNCNTKRHPCIQRNESMWVQSHSQNNLFSTSLIRSLGPFFVSPPSVRMPNVVVLLFLIIHRWREERGGEDMRQVNTGVQWMVIVACCSFKKWAKKHAIHTIVTMCRAVSYQFVGLPGMMKLSKAVMCFFAACVCSQGVIPPCVWVSVRELSTSYGGHVKWW